MLMPNSRRQRVGHWHGDGNGVTPALISFRAPAFVYLTGEFVLRVDWLARSPGVGDPPWFPIPGRHS
jgi:hypothetical protein